MGTQSETEDLLDEIAETVRISLTGSGIEDKQSRDAGLASAEAVRTNFSGQQIYIPSARNKQAQKRDEELFAAFTGDNHVELARHHGISVVHVYRIVRRKLAERRRVSSSSNGAAALSHNRKESIDERS